MSSDGGSPVDRFATRIRLDEARGRLHDLIDPIERTDRLPVGRADGRVLAAPVEARRDEPGYDRAAMDGYAVRAEDTHGASDRSPAILREVTDRVGPDEAIPVDTGEAIPEEADAVVMVEHTSEVGGEVEIFHPVPEGENVAPRGEDVAAGEELYEAGHRLRPPDLGLLRVAGIEAVDVYGRPQVSLIPTGEELVERDPGVGETIETNGLTLSRYADRWGAAATCHDPVTDDEAALRVAIERDLDSDLIVTSGGSSVGQRDLLPEVIEERGEMLARGVAIRPGRSAGFGIVEEAPILVLPGYPVSSIVTGVQLLRPAIGWLGHIDRGSFPTTEAELTGKIESEPGVRTFARVRLIEGDEEPRAEPIRAEGAGVLSSVGRADGWVEVPESREGFAAGAMVDVQDWDWRP